MITHILTRDNHIIATVQHVGRGDWVTQYAMSVAHVPSSIRSEAIVQSMLDPDGAWKEG